MEPNSNGLDIRLHIQQSETAKVLGHPTLLKYEINSSGFTQQPFQAPLPYFTDALLGLSAYKLTLHSKEYSSNTEEEDAVTQLWQGLEPLHEVYQRSFQRVKSLLQFSTNNKSPSEFEQKLEQGIADILKTSCNDNEIDFMELSSLLDCIDYFETKRHKPLLFDLQLQLPTATMEQLHTLNSVLYNLRALTAIYYNSHRKESLYETLHLDNVKDYFHAPDLLTNDTLLCHQFLTLKKKGEITGTGEGTLEKAFKNYLPHSYQLVQCLPESFFLNQSAEQLEQSLYSFQIDWLLGTPAGLLYRIREELNGLREGYEQTFWPELQHAEAEDSINILHVNCTLSAKHIQQLSESAA